MARRVNEFGHQTRKGWTAWRWHAEWHVQDNGPLTVEEVVREVAEWLEREVLSTRLWDAGRAAAKTWKARRAWRALPTHEKTRRGAEVLARECVAEMLRDENRAAVMPIAEPLPRRVYLSLDHDWLLNCLTPGGMKEEAARNMRALDRRTEKEREAQQRERERVGEPRVIATRRLVPGSRVIDSPVMVAGSAAEEERRTR